MTSTSDLYQQLIIDHSKKPRNFGKLEGATHSAEGYNPLCGDHLWIYLRVNAEGLIEAVSFEGSGCAISKASASLMTMELKGKSVLYAQSLFKEFHGLLMGQLENGQGETPEASAFGNPNAHRSEIGKAPATTVQIPPKLSIFSNVWQYPARVKCAALSWHAMNGALSQSTKVSTE